MCQTIAGERPASAAVSPVINLSGQTSVSQMVAVIARSGGVICSDSAAKFIAPAVGVGVVTLLGPTRVESTGPFVPGRHVRAESLAAPVACQGCLNRRCRHVTCMERHRPAIGPRRRRAGV